MAPPEKMDTTRTTDMTSDDNSSRRSAWRRDDGAHDINARLSQRIRQHRASLGMSLNVASKATGIPAATLSRIENNRMAPTMPLMLKLMTGLRITWSDLMTTFPPEMHESQISVAAEGAGERVMVHDNVYTVPHTDSSLRHYMQPVIFDIGSRMLDEAGGLVGHGGKELCFVLSGTIMLHFMNRAPVELGVGASALFNAEIPHAYVAKGRGRARVLMLHSVDPLMGDAEGFQPLLAVLRRGLTEDSPR